ncbi:Centaurin-gamma [Brachionus plicatilis]|uniref:Centaurin-gamma n=1 Tax=Brachionus plicatilis TaxID=10195 RepID=A0A3M7T5V7_BRAPC|nr:Centaurin-gamma [Brachionus plicatilis]
MLLTTENKTRNNNEKLTKFNSKSASSLIRLFSHFMKPSTTMMQKSNQLQQQITNGLFIRKEIQRFESVHPNIYSVYDLIESIQDFNLQQQIREHIVNIEDSFVNSQEWTLSRSVPDIKLGVLGSVNSGKSSLVHRFLTGTYIQEESPEGGRFKKEVIIDNQSYLLLIRDEGGPPEMQFTHWVDAVIFVFSLENEESFLTAHQYYTKMLNYRNLADIPFILVGTQDYISEANPRAVDDSRARNLAYELKKCAYYETCSNYGLHVERVFHEACQKVIQFRSNMIQSISNSSPTLNRPSTPQNGQSSVRLLAGSHINNLTTSTSMINQQVASASTGIGTNHSPNNPMNISPQPGPSYFMANPNLVNPLVHSQSNLLAGQTPVFKEPYSMQNGKLNGSKEAEQSIPTAITPCSTPNQKRKDTNRRRSNLFTPNKKEEKQNRINDMGVGRSIPIKQGFLYKKTNSTINKDWKKKFVTLNDDGSLRYYPSMNDYMDDVHGKEIDLQKTTIKIPGANKPRIGKSLLGIENPFVNAQKLNQDINSLNLNSNMSHQFDSNSKNHLSDDGNLVSQPANGVLNSNDNHSNNYLARIDINSKKRHRRIKSNHKSDQANGDEQEGYEFVIVSLDNKQWHFEAASNEEREEWVQAVEQQILSSLQLNETNKLKSKNGALTADNLTILTMKSVPGNMTCADCDATNPVWASLNHGSLICIECSGIHRNLGTHLSRVRSLELDDWSNELVQLMTSIGNKMMNSVYEAQCSKYSKQKPSPNTAREEKEKWIRAKYESKLFLAPLPRLDISLGKQLIDAVNRKDIFGVIQCLAHSKPEDVNASISQADKRTSLHLAASLSNLVILQLLIWYGADVEALDSQGRNALSYAKMANANECSQLLVHNGCSDISHHLTSTSTTSNLMGTLTRKPYTTSASTSHIISNNLTPTTYDKLSFNSNLI